MAQTLKELEAHAYALRVDLEARKRVLTSFLETERKLRDEIQAKTTEVTFLRMAMAEATDWVNVARELVENARRKVEEIDRQSPNFRAARKRLYDDLAKAESEIIQKRAEYLKELRLQGNKRPFAELYAEGLTRFPSPELPREAA